MSTFDSLARVCGPQVLVHPPQNLSKKAFVGKERTSTDRKLFVSSFKVTHLLN